MDMDIENFLLTDKKVTYTIKEVVDNIVSKGAEISLEVIAEKTYTPKFIIYSIIDSVTTEYYLNTSISPYEYGDFGNSFLNLVNKKKRIYKINKLLDI